MIETYGEYLACKLAGMRKAVEGAPIDGVGAHVLCVAFAPREDQLVSSLFNGVFLQRLASIKLERYSIKSVE